MKKTTGRKEFYESKWSCAFFIIFCPCFIFMLSVALLDSNKDWLIKIAACWIFGWCLWWWWLSLRTIFFKKEPYIIVDELRIKYKEKNTRSLLTMNTGKKQAFLWSEIKSLSLCDPYIKLGPIKFRMVTRHMNFNSIVQALKLNLRNGQIKWIFLHTMSESERHSFIDTIQKYKKVQFEKHSWFPIGIGDD